MRIFTRLQKQKKAEEGEEAKAAAFVFPFPFLSILCLSDARRKKLFPSFFLFLFSFFAELALLFSSPSVHFAYKKFFLPPPPSLPRNSDTATATATRPERHNFFFLPSPWVPFPPPRQILAHSGLQTSFFVSLFRRRKAEKAHTLFCDHSFSLSRKVRRGTVLGPSTRKGEGVVDRVGKVKGNRQNIPCLLKLHQPCTY